MGLQTNFMINFYSILFLLVLFYHADKQEERRSLQYRLYMLILKVTMILLAVDTMSRFDGNPDSYYSIFNQVGNFSAFLFSPLIPSIWLMFVYNQIFQDEDKTLRLIRPLSIASILNALILILTFNSGGYYSIDAANVYHRGPLYMISVMITVTLLLISLVMILQNRKRILSVHIGALLAFTLIPFLSIYIQYLFYGSSLILNSVVVGLLFVSLNIQNHGLNTDYLTGIYNRKKLDSYLNDKIRTCKEEKSFSAIMIDIDDFKSINDTFGHDMGDAALQATARLLNSCIRNVDFIARFGGDEFFIVLELSNATQLQVVVDRIESALHKFNRSNRQPYSIHLSMGYATYDPITKASAAEFLKRVDERLFEEKQRKHFEKKWNQQEQFDS